MVQAGARFGRYELLGALGAGGFAQVFRAWDPALGRELAIKTLLPHLAEDPQTRARFIAEARSLAALRHPNIVTGHDVGEADGVPFFAMELVEGQTLDRLVITGGALPLPRALDVMRAVASAVEYLHAAGVVHRDIKAANIMQDRAGRVVLMDFGIARAAGSGIHTLTGTSIGTPETMAPEQVRGEHAGPPADIYALGVLAFQLLSGHLPFTGNTARVLYAQVNEPPPLSALPPGLPPAVPAALAAALAKEPDRRPPGARAFLKMLERTAATTPPDRFSPAAPPPHTLAAATPAAVSSGSASRAPVLLFGGGLFVLLAVVALVLMVIRTGSGTAKQGAGAAANTPSNGSGGSSGGGRSAGATAQPQRAAAVSNLVVHDQVLAPGSRRDAFTILGSNVVACFRYQPGTAGGPLVVVATRDDRPPGGPDDPAVVARSEPVASEGGDVCAPLMLRGALPAPSTYHVWALFGTTVAGRGTFSALPSPTPSPSPSPPPTPTPAHRQGDLVRINTPGDCILIRAQPDRAATPMACKRDGGHLVVLGGARRDGDGNEWWPVRPYMGGTEGWSLGLYLVPSPECNSRRNDATCDTEIRATPTPTRTTTASSAGVSVAGDWTFTDYIRYGNEAGKRYSFRVRMTQQGDAVQGTGDVSFSGRLEGRTLRATYGQGGGGGLFLWTFTADGSRFEGSYTSSLGNGGNSYGRRATGSVSSVDMATIHVLVAGKPLEQTVRVGDDIWVCFTASRESRITLVSSLFNGPIEGYDNTSEDGTGDCAGPYRAQQAGPRTYRIEMRVNGQLVAQASTSFEILR